MPLFGFLSALFFAISWILYVAKAHTSVVFSSQSMMLLGLFCLAVHLVVGVVNWTRRQ